MFPAKKLKPSKKRKSTLEDVSSLDPDAPPPIDILVDVLIGFLEHSSAYMRAVANQVFSLLTALVTESTMDLILTQLERRDPTQVEEEVEVSDSEGDEFGSSPEGGTEEEEEPESGPSSEYENEEGDIEEDSKLRAKVEALFRERGAAAAETDNESEEELMDDDQMMAIDEQLAVMFRERGTGSDAKKQSRFYIF
jgi:DNA polymerase phi